MTKLIAVLIIVAALFGGWKFFLYWEKVKNEEEAQKKQAAAAVVRPESLAGLPQQYESGLRVAQQGGTATFRKWLKTYDKLLQDPRRAWIELDYCVAITREDPSEARRVFANVRARTPPSSPVWPRIKQLEKSYH